jgi:protein gp37
MSEKTGIAWADSTGNPWIGCTKVSPGCKHCYAAELDANKFSRTMGGATPENPISHWGKGAPRVRTKSFWKDAVKWNRDADPDDQTRADWPLCERPRIFPSLCDWLDDEVPIEWLYDFAYLMFITQNLDWLNLTKRPENFTSRIAAVLDRYSTLGDKPIDFGIWVQNWIKGTAPRNVWIGVSVEDQKRADERIPRLLQIPAKVRFLSVEPLLEKVDLKLGEPQQDSPNGSKYYELTEAGCFIDWVIVGGESGKDRRDCGVDAIVDVAKQCVAAGVPCFVKQDAAFKPGQQGRIPAETWGLKQFPQLPK